MSEIKMEKPIPESPIIYIMVIGFHHKLGCQLEFVYPENKLIKKNALTTESDLYTLPKRWAHLPSLALPDGSHNYNSDYIYFHLEDEDAEGTASIEEIPETELAGTKKKTGKKKSNRTLFGISCYRQINASEMIKKESNVTRNTLQKSVCILSTCPLYATSIRLKLHSITCAYFDQKDFNRTQLLIDAFNTTFRYSTALSDYSINYKNTGDENLIGLSLSDLVIRYQHRILILFKLILLQKKTLFQLKPVSNLSNTIISLISLIPDIFQPDKANNGLEHCSGFFDSIDLVNCELERKGHMKTRKLQDRKSMSTTHLAIGSANKKVKKKRMLSFSNKKKSSATGSFEKFSSGSSISSSPTSSTSSSPITTTTTATGNSLLSQIPANNQRLHNNSPHNSTLNSSSAGSNSTTTKENENPNNNDSVNWSDSNNQRSPTTLTSTPSVKHKKVKTKSFIEEDRQENSDSSLQHSYTEPRLQLEDLLQVDFGMPFNLFSEFNILHPYLSLYYLDYFTMINKMNTKLYCTTSLMLSMMNAAHSESQVTEEKVENQQEVGSNSSSMVSSSGSSSYSYQTTPNRPGADPRQLGAAPKPTIGYTIGATNALFKQRLYDDIDAFVDETSIDIKQNETLKKQLQLSTADLRFADYLIKHVNANRNTQQKNMNHNTPTLISVKKTSNSFCEVDENSINNPSMLSSANWEGSDEWIRLNFKWYFYSLLGSMVKEELCNETRHEAENLVSQLMSYDLSSQQTTNYSSSNSSTISLANEVVDIDDYIERASTKSSVRSSKKEPSGLKSARYSSYSLNPEKNNSQNNKNSPKPRKNSINQSVYSLNPTNNTLVAAQNYLNSTCANHVAYHDDFNSQYLAEFKKTDSYQTWADVNQGKLENNLFKLNDWLDADLRETSNMLSQLSVENGNQTDPIMLNLKLQSVIRKLQHLESTKLNHPFNGNLGVSDIKLRFNFLFTTTDSGKKINKALSEGSKIMNTTGRAVGDALSQAKSSFSSFFSSWSNSNSPNTSLNGSGKKSVNTSRIEDNQKFTNL